MLALIGSLLVTGSTATHAQTLRTIALSGDQAPGADPGVLISSLAAPALNDSGRTAFFVALTGAGVTDTNELGIYSERVGTPALVAREGHQAPGADPGVLFSGFNNLVLNGSGQTAFFGFLTGPGVMTSGNSNNVGIYSEGTGALAEVAREGNQVPGAEAGVVFEDFSSHFEESRSVSSDPFVLNDLGQTAFVSRLAGPGLTPDNNLGLYRGSADALTEVVRTGDQPPGVISPNARFRFLRSPTLNDTGQIAFLGLTNLGSGLDVYSDRTGELAPVALSDSQAPGAEPGFFFTNLFFPSLNNSGQAAFLGRLAGPGLAEMNNPGIYSEGTGVLAEVTRTGSRAPGADPGVLFIAFTAPAFNEAGQTAFFGFLTGPGVTSDNNAAVYSEGTGTLVEVARAGSQAPGADPGVLFSDFDVDNVLDAPTLNDLGQIAFVGELTGVGVDLTNDTGIYATDPDGVLVEIVRKGGQLDVNDDPLIDDFRTISDLSFLSGTDDVFNRSSGFNDRGQLAFFASFTDGSSGVFVSNLVAVPEPSTLLLTLLAPAGLLGRRR